MLLDRSWLATVRDVSSGTHHVINPTRPSPRFLYCKRQKLGVEAWERGYTHTHIHAQLTQTHTAHTHAHTHMHTHTCTHMHSSHTHCTQHAHCTNTCTHMHSSHTHARTVAMSSYLSACSATLAFSTRRRLSSSMASLVNSGVGCRQIMDSHVRKS